MIKMFGRVSSLADRQISGEGGLKLKKIILLLSVLMATISFPFLSSAQAAGIPITTPNNYVLGGWYFKTGNDWVYSNMLDSSTYFQGYVSGSIRGARDYSVPWVYVEVLGLDGTWHFAYQNSFRNTGGQQTPFGFTLNGYYKQIRFQAASLTNASFSPEYSAYVSMTIPEIMLGADQATAETAATAAQQARDAANNTVQYAQQARDAANNVNTIVNDTLTVNAGVVQDNQGTVLQAARDANKKLDNLSQTVTNISQSIPPVMNGIHGLNGATATSSGAIQVVIDASNATQYSYRIDSGGWSPWMPISDTVSIPVSKGVHTLTIQVANGPVGTPGPSAKSSMQVIGL